MTKHEDKAGPNGLKNKGEAFALPEL